MLRLLVFSLSWRLKISAATKVFNEDVKRKKTISDAITLTLSVGFACFPFVPSSFQIDLVVNRLKLQPPWKINDMKNLSSRETKKKLEFVIKKFKLSQSKNIEKKKEILKNKKNQ